MKIKVEQRHIDAGVKFGPSSCPIALALMDCVPHGPEDVVSVGTHSCGVEPHGRGDLPPAAWDFIRHFDQGLPVAPFEFEIEFAPEVAP